jgi:metal-responsive CopG/Arc/MetJ family transcriptional regulator
MSRENRVPIMLTDEELKALDDWRFANRVATRSEAIRRLMAFGLAAPKKEEELPA